MTAALVDNDVLCKTVGYGLIRPLLAVGPGGATTFYMLGAAQFIIAKKLARQLKDGAAERVKEVVALLQELLHVVEPTGAEIELAAEFEYLAAQAGKALDSGESLLCAVLSTRGYRYLFTGDKRACIAISVLVQHAAYSGLAKTVVCMEQLIQILLDHLPLAVLREAICANAHTDKALANCFACQSPTHTRDAVLEGLRSYIIHLHSAAPDVLCDSKPLGLIS